MGTSTSKNARSTSHQSASARQSAADHPGDGSSRASARGRAGPEVGAASIAAGTAASAGAQTTAHTSAQTSAHSAAQAPAHTTPQQSMRTFLGESSEGEWHPELHGNGLTPFDPMQRHEMISQAAYFIAEKRDFALGGADDDWLKAELEIDRLLTQVGVQAAKAN
jgi:Protein of unknown function (DUF2934)